MAISYEQKKQMFQSGNTVRNNRNAINQAQEERKEALRLKAKQQYERANANVFDRIGETALDLVGNVLTGAAKGLEGIYDFGAGIVGAVGGVFDQNFQQEVQRNIAGSWVNDTFQNPLNDATKNSFLNDGEVGSMVREVASGIGQMLPAVAVTVATGGAGAASLATLGVSAAGNATEEAYNDGADYYSGLGYGALSGGIEVATEKMFGGATKGLYGEGLLDKSLRKGVQEVGEQGVKRIGKEMLEEGIEEVVSELASPLAKSIYKGGEALKDYESLDYWKGVGEAGLVGAATSAVYSGTVGRVMSAAGKGNVGKNADIASSIDAINTQTENAERLQSRGVDYNSFEQPYTEAKLENLANIEKTLKSESEAARKKTIERFANTEIDGVAFSEIVNPDGSIKTEFKERYGTLGDNGAIVPNSTLASGQKRYANASAINNTKEVMDSLGKVNASLEEKGGQAVEVYNGELDATQSEAYTKVKKVQNQFNKISGNNANLVVVSESGKFNGVKQGNTIFVTANALKDGSWKKTIIHENTHLAEGTKEYDALYKAIESNAKLSSIVNAEMSKKAYGFNKSINEIAEKLNKGEELTAEEKKAYKEYVSEKVAHASAYELGNDDFINEMINTDRNLLGKIVQRIENVVNTFKRLGDPEARQLYKETKAIQDKYLKAIEKSGYEYKQGKIIARKKEELNRENLAKSLQERGIKTSFAKNLGNNENADNGRISNAILSDYGGVVRFNLSTYKEGGRAILEKNLVSKGFAKADVGAALKTMDDLASFFEEVSTKYKDVADWNNAEVYYDDQGRAIYSAMVNNGDYPLNIDLSTICRKRKALTRVLNELVKRDLIGGLSLTADNIVKINDILKKNGFEVACPACFVETKRYRAESWANDFIDAWNGVIDTLNIKGVETLDFSHGKTTVSNGDVDTSGLEAAVKKGAFGGRENNLIAKTILEHPELRGRLQKGDFFGTVGLDTMKKVAPDLYTRILNKAGSATPKITQEFSPYNSELGLFEKLAEKAKDVGGVRMFSFSAFTIEQVFDYMQVVADLASQKATMHTYTKVISFAKIFGKTGIKINMSMIPNVDKTVARENAGLDSKGNLIWSEYGVDYNEAIALMSEEGYSENVGTATIGISDAHIRKLLANKYTNYIIPYHKSNINPIVAKMTAIDWYTDYTSQQSTRYRNGVGENIRYSEGQTEKHPGKPTKVSKSEEFNFFESLDRLGDAKAMAREYLAYCDEHGFVPKFEQFTAEENYYKLLVDFQVYDTLSGQPALQRPAELVFPDNIKRLIEEELDIQEEAKIREAEVFEGTLGEIVSAISFDLTDADENGVRFSLVADETLNDKLNKEVDNGDYYVTYKSMTFWGYDENGNAILRSPMAEYVDGKLSGAYLMPKKGEKLRFYEATETIDEESGLPSGLLARIPKTEKSKYKKSDIASENAKHIFIVAKNHPELIASDWSNTYFLLLKMVEDGTYKNGEIRYKPSPATARYAPYEHSSNYMLNDQFDSAWRRANLVTVKMIVPKSQANGAYRANYAKDATGWTEWHAGLVASHIGQQKPSFNRQVFLSKYAAPYEIVSDEEVAKAYKEYLRGTNVKVPDNVVSPNLLKELKKAGVPIKVTGKIKFEAQNWVGDKRVDLTDTSNDVQFDLTEPRIELTGEEIKRIRAMRLDKSYTKVDAQSIIDDIVMDTMIGEDTKIWIDPKDRKEISKYYWDRMNAMEEGKRGALALDIADYIIHNGVVDSIYYDDSADRETLGLLKSYTHKVDLSSVKNDVSESTYGLFNKNDGISVDDMIAELEQQGVFVNEDNNAAYIDKVADTYYATLNRIGRIGNSIIAASYNAEEIKALKQEIAREVLNGFDEKGKHSYTYLKNLVQSYQKKISNLKTKYIETVARNKAKNSLVYEANKIKELRKGHIFNATQFVNTDIFKDSIGKLGNINWRGDLNESGTREIVGNVLNWYKANKDTLLEGKYYDDDVALYMANVALGKGELTAEEMVGLVNVLRYFNNLINEYNVVYISGQKADALVKSKEYVQSIDDNLNVKVNFLSNKMLKSYATSFFDPMTIARGMDKYQEGGFFGDMVNSFRDAAIEQGVAEMEINEPFVEFNEKHKKYLENLDGATMTYNGVEIPKRIGMSLYMTIKRQQAQGGLLLSGFSYMTYGKNDVKHKVNPFLTASEIETLTDEDIIKKSESIEEKLFAQFTDTDKEYIQLMTDALAKCKDLKVDTDNNRLGFSNAEEEWYFPIRRDNIAISIDTDYAGESSSVNNKSFNKNIVKGAKGMLYLEPIDIVVTRHIKGITQYAKLGNAIDAYDRIYNLDTSGNPNAPVSVRTESDKVMPDIGNYMKTLRDDIVGLPKDRGHAHGVSKITSALRGGYAKYQLGANPKVWVTQLSSLLASTSILSYGNVVKGLAKNGSDVDTYCPLAKLRNSENTVAKAQGVMETTSGKFQAKTEGFTNAMMEPIGMMDRYVVEKLFCACQLQVEQDQHLEVGTKENKQAAGELLKKVILETQQNATATDRSEAMRSSSEFKKTITMFTADAMKTVGRVIEGIGKVNVLKQQINATQDATKRASLEKQLAAAKKDSFRRIGALISVSFFQVLIAAGFKWLYNKFDDDDDAGDIALEMSADFVGNMVGGLPLVKDLTAYFLQGYELNSYNYSAINDLAKSVSNLTSAMGEVGNWISTGKFDSQKIMSAFKSTVNAVGQITGVPTRNIYNVLYGLTKRVSPATAYKIDNVFYDKSYNKDLARAIERQDKSMIDTIIGLKLNESVGGITDKASREEINRLTESGFSVLPKTMSNTVTVEGEEITMSKAEYQDAVKVYNKANNALASLVSSKAYKNANDDVKARSIAYLYNTYYNVATDYALDLDTTKKAVLMAEAINIEDLAIIIAYANSLEADTDKKGNVINGSKKAKIQKYVASLNLTASQKYMIMGYLGYRNQNGESGVKSYINRLKLTASEKAQLLAYSGYAS